MVKNKIIVGHALLNDFDVLNYTHEESRIRDTQKFLKYENVNGNLVALKTLCRKFLGKVIQANAHDSVSFISSIYIYIG